MKAIRRRGMTIGLLCAAALVALAAMAPLASATTTHKFIKQLNLPVSGVQLMGVDQQGNLIVWAQNAIRKFSPNGDPVPFSALGTNTIDGAGGGNCPTTPADCDQTPWNGLGSSPFFERVAPVLADMNQSHTGPSAGYMYVATVKEVEPGVYRSRTVVFDGSGKYRGEIDTSQPAPARALEGVPLYLSVSPNGSIVISYSLETGGSGEPLHADKYQVSDANPANDRFAGQIRKQDPFDGTLTGGNMQLGTVADDDYAYVGRGGFLYQPESLHPTWEIFESKDFGLASGNTPPLNLDPNKCECDSAGPWGDGGRNEESGQIFDSVSVDPADHHAYLLDSYTGTLEEWATPTERLGPQFGSAETTSGASGQLAFDTSGITSTDGRIYINRGSSVAVFSPPVPIADIEGLQATVGHADAQVNATIGLDHGPNVTSCQVQWGEEVPEQPTSFGQAAPCQPATPYSSESTPISTHIPGLRPRRTTASGSSSKPTTASTAASRSRSGRPPSWGSKPIRRTKSRRRPPNCGARWTRTACRPSTGSNTASAPATPRKRRKNPAARRVGSVAVAPVEIGGLQPGRRYHFRLVASNETLGTTAGPDRSFVAASAPAVSGLRPSDIRETSATLSALVNPGGYPTTYQFEYGPTSTYGSSKPSPAANIGEGVDPVPVSVEIDNLDPGVEYHFRVVATNEWGTEASEDATFTFFPSDCPNAYARQLTRSAYLPDCRAYELVSPRDAGGIQLYPGDLTQDYLFYNFSQLPYLKTYAQNLGTATSPGRFSFLGLSGQLPGTNSPNSLIDTYTATRTVDGWVSRYWGLTGNVSYGAGGAECDLQGETCIDYKVPEILGNSDPNFKGSHAPYVWDFEGNSLGRWPTNLGVVKGGEDYVGDDHPSPDFSHYIFSSNNVRFTPDGVLRAPGSAYDNDVEAASVEKASLLPGGADIQEGAGGGGGGSEEFIKIPAVSTDGSHILMTTQGVGDSKAVNLYMRVDGAVSYPIAQGKQPLKLIGMTSDGSKVVFASTDRVTADDTDSSEDIFVWSEQTNEITRVSQGNGAGDSDACQTEEGAVCPASPLVTQRPDSDDPIASESGDVYFYSPEQLDPNSPGLANEKNLYVYRHGAVKYVATLDKGTAIDRIQISPDGAHAAFLTASRMTSYDNQGWREMYTYDPETGVIRCVSCIPSGEPPQVLRPEEAPGSSGDRGLRSKDVMASQSGRFMSDDGRTAFATADALVENDTDGLVDVYEFAGGRPQLISSGAAQTDFLPGNQIYPGEYIGLEAVSHDGVDLYFTTFDTLAPDEDENGQFLKFYDARTNGGFPPPPAHLPCVAADECHGAENPGPENAVIGTGANLGPASTPAKVTEKKKKKHHKKRAKARHKRHRQGGEQRNG